MPAPVHPIVMVVPSSTHAKQVQRDISPRELVAIPMMRAPMPGSRFRAALIVVPPVLPEGFEEWITSTIRPRLAEGCQGRVTYLGAPV